MERFDFCPSCGRARIADDERFCPKCGRRLEETGSGAADLAPTRDALVDVASNVPASVAPTPWTPPAKSRLENLTTRQRFGIVLIVVGVVGAGAIASALLRPPVEFSPATLRCDGSERTWTMRLPATTTQIKVEMYRDADLSRIPAEVDTENVSELARYRQADGSYRVVSTSYDAWECRQAPGRYTMVILDSSNSDALIGSVDFNIAE